MMAALAVLRWPMSLVAQQLSCDEKLVRRWGDGSAAIPPDVATWLTECRRIAAGIHWPPPPTGWRTNPHYFPAPQRRARRRKAPVA
jgi:hypothetical protein